MLTTQLAHAQGYFLPADDSRLRDDVILIVDEGVINLPTNAWPIPTADVAKAVSRIKPEDIGEPALRAASWDLGLGNAGTARRGRWILPDPSSSCACLSH